MADFPAAVTSLTDPTSTSKLNSPSHADQHINANAEIEAVETELGVNPAGAESTVVARLNAELGALHFNVLCAAASTGSVFFSAPYNCTLSGYVNFTVSAGTGRTVLVKHGSAGDNCLVTATQAATGTIGKQVACTTSLATVSAAETMHVSISSSATAQVYGVTVIMTNAT
jgi:hypothetical protein